MVQYVEIIDQENPSNPNQENVAKELQNRIKHIEADFKVKFASACFLGEACLPMEDEGSVWSHAVEHDKVCKYMLFFVN